MAREGVPYSSFSPADLAPGVDEIYEESKEVFLTPGHPQDGQVVFYKVGTAVSAVWSSPVLPRLGLGAAGSLPLVRQTLMRLSCLLMLQNPSVCPCLDQR